MLLADSWHCPGPFTTHYTVTHKFLPKIERGKNDESFLQLFCNSNRGQKELKDVSEKLLLHFLNLHYLTCWLLCGKHDKLWATTLTRLL